MDAVIALARRFKHVTEDPPGSNRQQFGVWYGMNGQPWCAMFVSYLLHTCGYRFPGATTAKGWAYVPYVYDYFKRRNAVGEHARVGALALFHNGKRFYHIEVVTKLARTGYWSIGGNTGRGDLANGGQVLEHFHRFDSRTRFCYLDDWTPKHAAPVVAKRVSWQWNLALTSPMAGSDRKHTQLRKDIRRAQVGLAKAGLLPNTASSYDSVYGPATERAVRAFQKRRGLKVDGVLGATTAAHLGL